MPLNPRPRESEVDPTSARPGDVSFRDEERGGTIRLGLDDFSVRGRVAGCKEGNRRQGGQNQSHARFEEGHCTKMVEIPRLGRREKRRIRDAD